MAARLVHIRAEGGLTCGHPTSPATTRAAPKVGEVYCALCALESLHALQEEIARTAAVLACPASQPRPRDNTRRGITPTASN
jgi:hypothetical protein